MVKTSHPGVKNGMELIETMLFGLATGKAPLSPKFGNGTTGEQISAELQRHNVTIQLILVRYFGVG